MAHTTADTTCPEQRWFVAIPLAAEAVWRVLGECAVSRRQRRRGGMLLGHVHDAVLLALLRSGQPVDVVTRRVWLDAETPTACITDVRLRGTEPTH